MLLHAAVVLNKLRPGSKQDKPRATDSDIVNVPNDGGGLIMFVLSEILHIRAHQVIVLGYEELDMQLEIMERTGLESWLRVDQPLH